MFAASIDDISRAGPSERPADEEVAAAAHEPRRPDAERDDADRVDDEQQEVQVHGERPSGAATCTSGCVQCHAMRRRGRSIACSPRSTMPPTRSSRSPSDLIRIPTVNPPGEAYEDCARLIGARLAAVSGSRSNTSPPTAGPSTPPTHPRVNVVGARRGRARAAARAPQRPFRRRARRAPAGRSIRSAALCATAASTGAARAT